MLIERGGPSISNQQSETSNVYLITRRFAGAAGGVVTPCDTLTAMPATVMMADRVVPPLAGMVKVAVPEPVPDPLVNVTQDMLADDVHAHPACVVTVMVPEPPPPGMLNVSGATVKVHDEAG